MSKKCYIAEDSEKCIECVQIAKLCDLAPINIAQWKCLEAQRHQLKKKLEQAIAKQLRFLSQINKIKDTQQIMVETELKNIELLKKAEKTLNKVTINDMVMAAKAFSNIWQEWLPSTSLFLKLFQWFLAVLKVFEWFSCVVQCKVSFSISPDSFDLSVSEFL